VQTDKIPYRDEQGNILGVIVFAVDITDRKRAEEALQKSHADLERLVQERTQSLMHANEALRTQVQERLQAEKALQRAYEELEWRVSERTAELARSQEQLRALAVHLESVREEERTTIARDIHDELGQALTALNMDLSWMRNRLPKSKPLAPLHEKASAMAGLITHTIESVRRIATELRPGVLDHLGLVAAMEWQASAFQKRYGIACRLVLPAGEIELNAQRSTALFRMLQEALTNVVRHAGATSVTITLDKTDAEVRLTVEDDGKGLSEESLAAPLSLGIVGIRERALALGGAVRIQGIPGSGTTVEVSLPLNGGSHDAEEMPRADRG
jgi:signal transduction histidine kinase